MGSARRRDQQPGGNIRWGKRDAQTPAPDALGWRGLRGVRTAPASRLEDRDCSPGSRSPLKHLLWRLETEFENPPISGGRRSGPGQSHRRTAGLAAPRSLGAPGRAFRPHPPNCCNLGPLPLPGTWKPGFREPIPAGDAGPAAAGGQGGGGRGGGRRGSFVEDGRPAQVLQAGGAGRARAQPGGGKADGGGKDEVHTLDAAAASPSPSSLRRSEGAQACWGKHANTECWGDLWAMVTAL